MWLRDHTVRFSGIYSEPLQVASACQPSNCFRSNSTMHVATAIMHSTDYRGIRNMRLACSTPHRYITFLAFTNQRHGFPDEQDATHNMQSLTDEQRCRLHKCVLVRAFLGRKHACMYQCKGTQRTPKNTSSKPEIRGAAEAAIMYTCMCCLCSHACVARVHMHVLLVSTRVRLHVACPPLDSVS
jgi:hypothetical protein